MMQAHTKEFHEVREQFEKDAKNLMYGHQLDRVSQDDKVPAGVFYNDGLVNQFFQFYMAGYAYAKALHRLDG